MVWMINDDRRTIPNQENLLVPLLITSFNYYLTHVTKYHVTNYVALMDSFRHSRNMLIYVDRNFNLVLSLTIPLSQLGGKVRVLL